MNDPVSSPPVASREAPGRPPAFGPLGRGWKAVLLVSLGANLIVAGLVAGAILTGPKGPPPGRELAFGPYTFALTPEDRQALFAAYRERRAGPLPQAAMEQERSGFAELLRQEPFDRAAAAAFLDAQRVRADERFRMGQGILLDRLAAISPEARAAMATRLEAGPPGHGRGDGDAEGRKGAAAGRP